MNTHQLEQKRYQDSKDREALDDLTDVTPFKDFGQRSAVATPPQRDTPESIYEPYKPKFRHSQDNYTNARRIREIIRGVSPVSQSAIGYSNTSKENK